MFKTLIHFSHFLKKFRAQLLPFICVLCGQSAESNHMFCVGCQKDLPILSHCCQICAQILIPADFNAGICGTCIKKTPSFDKIYALFSYQAPISNLVIRLKFRHELYIANVLGKLLGQRIQTLWYKEMPLPNLIIPVPLHKKRLRERGFNQALEIAKIIAKTISIPIDCTHTERIKETAAQSGLSAQKRKFNMENAFSVKRDYNGLFIAVVDDVVTTGHTIDAFCTQLRLQGAKRIDIWCVARRQ